MAPPVPAIAPPGPATGVVASEAGPYRNGSKALTSRFRFLLGHQPNVSKAQHDAVKAYDDRLIGLSKLQGKIDREHQRLQNLLG